jgi:drug/metabolite transporter (DMT)-like permease
MTRRYVVMLILLAAIWGASFMFIKVAVRELDPATMIASRLALAAVALALMLPLVVQRGHIWSELRSNAPTLVLVGIVNAAIPFWLLAWAEKRIDSGLAATIQGAVPIFTAVAAVFFFPSERVRGLRLVGIGLGFAGVALLVGAQPEGQIVGALAVVACAVCYAFGGLLAARNLRTAPPPVMAFGTTAAAALVTLGPGIARGPHHVPGWKVIGSVVMLAVPATALAYLLLFALLSGVGASRASLVSYLIPPSALAYGAVLLGEPIGAFAVGGLVLVLTGIALAARRGVNRPATGGVPRDPHARASGERSP